MSEVINKRLWVLSVPIFMELILTITLLVTDTLFLSRISDTAAASIGATFTLIGVCLFLFEALAYGGGSVAAQYMGAKRNDEVASIFTATLFLNLVVGLVISLFFFFFHNNVAILLGFSDEALRDSSLYLSILGSAMILQAIKCFYSSIISSLGKTYWNMIITLTANIVNILVNFAFIYGVLGIYNLGVAGVAIATVIAYAISVGMSIVIVHFRIKIKFAVRKFIKDFRKNIYSILSISIPSALEPVSYHLSQVCISIMIIKLGNIALGARSYVFNISEINFVWYYSLALGTQILLAHMVGGKHFDRANKRLLRSLFLGVFGSFIITLLCFLTAKFSLQLFTHNTEIISIGTAILGIGIIFGPLSAANTIITSALRATGDAKYTSFMGIIVMWVIGIPFCYFLGIHLGFGLVGIIVGMTIDEFVRAVLNFRRWNQKHWESTGVILNEEGLEAAQAEI